MFAHKSKIYIKLISDIWNIVYFLNENIFGFYLKARIFLT